MFPISLSIRVIPLSTCNHLHSFIFPDTRSPSLTQNLSLGWATPLHYIVTNCNKRNYYIFGRQLFLLYLLALLESEAIQTKTLNAGQLKKHGNSLQTDWPTDRQAYIYI